MSDTKGLYLGKSHAEGGIPAVNTDTGQHLEIEGNEYKICNSAYSSNKILRYSNKNNKEILDDIHDNFSCRFNKNEVKNGEFILCKVVVLDPTKRSRKGTVRQILDEMQSEKSCNVSQGATMLKNGGFIPKEKHNAEVNAYEYRRPFQQRLQGDKLSRTNGGTNIEPVFTGELQHVVQIREGLSGGSSLQGERTRIFDETERGLWGNLGNSNGALESTEQNFQIRVDEDVISDLEDKIEFEQGGEISEDDKIYKEWTELVNMSASELKAFMKTDEGKDAGLDPKEAKRLGIKSGQESAKWIIKMKSTNKDKWTLTMWDWAKRQINFIKRMSGNKGKLFDENGMKTRKHTSLLIWGRNPMKYEDGGEIKSN